MVDPDVNSSDETIKNSKNSKNTFKCCNTKESGSLVCVKCFELYHKSCGKRVNLKIVEKNKVLCPECQGPPNGIEDRFSELLKAKNETIGDKNRIIKAKDDLIVELMKKIHNLEAHVAAISSDKQVVDAKQNIKEKNNRAKDSEGNIDKREINKDTEKKAVPSELETRKRSITNVEVGAAVQAVQQSLKMSEVVNLEKDEDDLEWTRVNRTANQRNRKTRPPKVIGTGCKIESNLKAAERKAWIFIRKTNKDTTETVIKNHIAAIVKHNDFTVQIKESKYNNKNFIVSIPINDMDAINNPQNWPQGISLEKYIFRRAPRETPVG